MKTKKSKSVAIIVTHPDEETLWAGGTILNHPFWNCFVVCLTKANDSELAPRFFNALKVLKAEGVMGNIEERIESKSINDNELERAIVQLLPNTAFDIIITHNSVAENPNNEQHNAVSKSVIKLWQDRIISADELWTFANEEENIQYHTRPIEVPDVQEILSKHIWSRKYNIITRIFNFNEKSWQFRTIPSTETFWKYNKTFKHIRPVKPFGYSLSIFRKPNIEALKFLYHKSIAFVYDNNYWKYEKFPITENLEVNEQLKKSWGKDLSIFATPSIDYLKTLYYNSISFLFDGFSAKTDIAYSDYLFGDKDNLNTHNKPRRKFVKELMIFRAPTIEGLKSMYSKSVAFVFEKNIQEPEIALCSDNNNLSNDTNRFDKELKIFTKPTIECLKKSYNLNNLK